MRQKLFPRIVSTSPKGGIGERMPERVEREVHQAAQPLLAANKLN